MIIVENEKLLVQRFVPHSGRLLCTVVRFQHQHLLLILTRELSTGQAYNCRRVRNVLELLFAQSLRMGTADCEVKEIGSGSEELMVNGCRVLLNYQPRSRGLMVIERDGRRWTTVADTFGSQCRRSRG